MKLNGCRCKLWAQSGTGQSRVSVHRQEIQAREMTWEHLCGNRSWRWNWRAHTSTWSCRKRESMSSNVYLSQFNPDLFPTWVGSWGSLGHTISARPRTPQCPCSWRRWCRPGWRPQEGSVSPAPSRCSYCTPRCQGPAPTAWPTQTDKSGKRRQGEQL